MARTIEVRRHTDNDGDRLSPDGVAAALALGRHLAGTVFDLIVTTGAQRTTQTAANVLAAGVGHRVARGVVVEPGLRSEVEDRWRSVYAETGSGHLDDFRRADPDLVASEARILGAALRRVAGLLEDGERALVIGHSPTNEAAVLGLAGVTIDPLGKGEGVVITGDGDVWEVAPASMP